MRRPDGFDAAPPSPEPVRPARGAGRRGVSASRSAPEPSDSSSAASESVSGARRRPDSGLETVPATGAGHTGAANSDGRRLIDPLGALRRRREEAGRLKARRVADETPTAEIPIVGASQTVESVSDPQPSDAGLRATAPSLSPAPVVPLSSVTDRPPVVPDAGGGGDERGDRATSPRAARVAARRASRQRRRFERAEVRRFTRRSRHRRAAWLTAGGVAALFAGLIAVAVFSPLLAMEEIEVRGTVRLDPQQVQDAVGGQVGTPLALVDFDLLQSDLEAFPLIRSYVTETVPPHTLVIHVTERQPVASVMTDAGYLLVDPAGVSIEVSETRPAGVPLIDMEESEVGGEVFDAIIEVLLALPPDLGASVDSVAATTMDDVTLGFTGVGQRVVWGSADRSELKARVLERLVAAHDPGLRVEYDVTAPLSAVVRPI